MFTTTATKNWLNRIFLFVVFGFATTSCFVIDMGWETPAPEGPEPSNSDIQEARLVVIRSISSVLGNPNVPTYNDREVIAYRLDPYIPNSVDFLVFLYANTEGQLLDAIDPMFITQRYNVGDTIAVTAKFATNANTIATLNFSHDDKRRIPVGYNSENKNWRIATHLVTKLHSVNGISVE
jgi:hypothetical protein